MDETILCDWCDRPHFYRHVDNVEEVKACIRHHSAYLAYLQRVRVLDSRCNPPVVRTGAREWRAVR